MTFYVDRLLDDSIFILNRYDLKTPSTCHVRDGISAKFLLD